LPSVDQQFSALSPFSFPSLPALPTFLTLYMATNAITTFAMARSEVMDWQVFVNQVCIGHIKNPAQFQARF
jgi:hypothetical protein